MESEQLQAAKAANRDVSINAPDIEQDCTDIVNISVFFDGTGNNKAVDDNEMKWSNPARLWLAAFNRPNPTRNNYPIYISGVGTPYNGTATGWLDSAEIKFEDKALGNGSGGGGTRRTEFGQSNVNKALRQALLSNAKKLSIPVDSYAKKGGGQGIGGHWQSIGQASPNQSHKFINFWIFSGSSPSTSVQQ